MASGSLTSFIPNMYEALDIVSRELTGFIPSVSRNANAERAGLNQVIRVPVTGAATASDIVPSNVAADTTSETPGYVDITISNQRKVPVNWTGEEQKGYGSNGTLSATLSQQIAQAMRTLANEVEADIAAHYVGASRAYGTAGSTPFSSTLGDAAQIKKILDDNGAPDDGMRSLVVNTAAGANLRTLANLNQANTAGSDATLRGGVLLPIFGMDIRESAQVKAHTKGTMIGADCTAIEPIGETTIAFDGSNSGTILAGDVAVIGSDTNKYIVKTGAAGAATGSFVIGNPGLLNATAIADEIVLGGSYAANMGFHKSAIQLVSRMPAMPEGGDGADDIVEIFDPVSGLGFQLAVYRQYHQVHYEIGIAWGVQIIKPEFCAILLG